jgi:hypothetical protein
MNGAIKAIIKHISAGPTKTQKYLFNAFSILPTVLLLVYAAGENGGAVPPPVLP